MLSRPGFCLSRKIDLHLCSITVLERDPHDDNQKILHSSRGRGPLEYHSSRRTFGVSQF